MIAPAIARITLVQIIHAVADELLVTPQDIIRPVRFRRVNTARHMVVILALALTRLSKANLGNYLGGRHHATIIHAERCAKQLLREDAIFADAYHRVRIRLEGMHHE